jgi:hypothetical protein
VRTLKCEKPATALGSDPASRTDQLGGRVNSENILAQSPPQEIFAELTAYGISALAETLSADARRHLRVVGLGRHAKRDAGTAASPPTGDPAAAAADSGGIA